MAFEEKVIFVSEFTAKSNRLGIFGVAFIVTDGLLNVSGKNNSIVLFRWKYFYETIEQISINIITYLSIFKYVRSSFYTTVILY